MIILSLLNFKQPRFWFIISILTTLIILSVMLFYLMQFDNDLDDIKPGTYIRPMGMTFLIGMLGITSIIAGILLSIITVIMALIQKSRKYFVASAIILIFSFVPLFSAHSLFISIVEKHKLLLDD